MSGIVGIVNFDGRPVDRAAIAAMTGAMAHRGPDGIFCHVEGSAGFGYCRTATTAESMAQDQPIVGGSDRFIMVMDGWLENYADLIADLRQRGAKLRTKDDAEIVMCCFEQWGKDLLDHLRGDFAFAIWDRDRKRLFCARDRVGHRPFNYMWNGNSVVFASEVSAILALPWIERRLNEGTLAEFLAASWHSLNETFWSGILRMPAANKMVVDVHGPQISTYWTPEAGRERLIYKTEAEYAEHHLAVLSAAVRAASRSVAPLSMQVSGGLDSSSVFAIANRLQHNGELLAPSKIGLTMVFRDDPDADESELTREISEFLGAPIEEIEPTLKPFSWYRERARSELEFAGFANNVMSVGMRQRAADLGAKVILSGSGGDEWLSDFWQRRAYYREELLSLRLSNLLEWARQDAATFGWSKVTYLMLSRGLLPRVGRRTINRALGALRHSSHPDDAPVGLLNPDLGQALEARRTQFSDTRREWQLERPLLLGDPFMARAAEVEERMSSRLGLEIRHPLKSSTLIEYSLSLPERFLVKGNTMKYLHRKSLSGILPSRIVKLGNKATVNRFVRQHLARMKQSVGTLSSDWYRPGMLEYLTSERPDGPGSLHVGVGTRLWVLGGFYGCKALIDK